MSSNTTFWKPYLSPRFIAGKLRKNGIVFYLKVLLPLLWRFLPMLLAIPVVLCIRALRSCVLIRLGPLRSERIGHFAGNTEMYLCRRDAGMDNQRAIDIFYHTSPVCNWQLKKMWDRTLHVSPLACPVDRLNRLLPGGESHVIPWPRTGDRDIHDLLSRTRAHLSFTPEEERRGLAALRQMGIPEGTPFICFFARDTAYLDFALPNVNWHRGGYHDYQNSNIHNYIPAAEEMTRRGYFAIRMGYIVKEALTTSNPMIIDYATKYRTDFLDIYLGAKCRFFICGDGAGIHAIPMIFRRPIAYVNFVHLTSSPTCGRGVLFIPRKFWLREDRRFLTFSEILNSEIERFTRIKHYEDFGIDIVENTAEEILDLTRELNGRLDGNFEYTEEDEELQSRFLSLFQPHHGCYGSPARIGAKFLRQNRELLR